MATLSFVNSFGNFQYMYALESILDGTGLNYIVGSLYDDTVYCTLAKLDAPSFGYTSIVTYFRVRWRLVIWSEKILS